MAQKNIEINVKTATGYDQLYPKSKAEIITYDNTNSELAANTVQDAIDELETMVPSQDEKDDWNNKSDKAVSFWINLPAGDWDGDSKTITVADEKFIADGYAYIVAPSASAIADYATSQIYADEIVTDGEITFVCEVLPVTDLIVNVLRVVVTE